MKKVVKKRTAWVRNEDGAPSIVKIQPKSRKVTIQVKKTVVAPPPPPPVEAANPFAEFKRPNRFVSITATGAGALILLLAVDSDGRVWRQYLGIGKSKNDWLLYDETSV